MPADLRAAAARVGSSAPAAILTLLAGVVVGTVGFLRFAADTASRNNELMLEVGGQGEGVTTAMPVASTMLALMAFVVGTPLGWLAVYLTLTGLVRAVSASVGEPRGDPLLALAAGIARRAARRRRDIAASRARELLEGTEVGDRLVPPARFGVTGADLVVVASRRKPDWTPGTVLDCEGRWFRVGESQERTLAVGLRTLYPLREATETEVFRRIVPYVLPPLPPGD